MLFDVLEVANDVVYLLFERGQFFFGIIINIHDFSSLKVSIEQALDTHPEPLPQAAP